MFTLKGVTFIGDRQLAINEYPDPVPGSRGLRDGPRHRADGQHRRSDRRGEAPVAVRLDLLRHRRVGRAPPAGRARPGPEAPEGGRREALSPERRALPG